MLRSCLLISILVLGSALGLNRQTQRYDITEANYALANGKPIFYQIVMGTFPMRNQYKLWFSALRQIGKYNGTVMIVTDKPGCIVNGLGQELLGGEKTYSDSDVDIYPGTGEGKVHILKVKTPQSVIGIKLHKSRAWSNLKKAKIDHPVSSIIYTDTDVIVGENLRKWLQYEQSLERKGYTLALFPDVGFLTNKDETQNLHTGVVIMFPSKESQTCIEKWGYQLSGGNPDPPPVHHFANEKKASLLQQQSTGVDQQALVRTNACNENKGIMKMHESYLSLPDARQLRTGKTSTFMHITNTKGWKEIDDKVKSTFFYRKLGLSEDIDFGAKGSCPQEMWDTPEYRKLNAKTKH